MNIIRILGMALLTAVIIFFIKIVVVNCKKSDTTFLTKIKICLLFGTIAILLANLDIMLGKAIINDKSATNVSVSQTVSGEDTIHSDLNSYTDTSSRETSFYVTDDSDNVSGATSTMHECTMCHGTRRCHVCNGSGQVWNDITDEYRTCGICYGDGECNHCNGTGYVIY